MDIHRDQGKEPVEQEAPSRPQKKGGKKKPWKLEYRTRMKLHPGWHRGGRYEKESQVRQAFKTQKKKAIGEGAWLKWDWRIIDPDGNIVETFLAEK